MTSLVLIRFALYRKTSHYVNTGLGIFRASCMHVPCQQNGIMPQAIFHRRHKHTENKDKKRTRLRLSKNIKVHVGSEVHDKGVKVKTPLDTIKGNVNISDVTSNVTIDQPQAYDDPYIFSTDTPKASADGQQAAQVKPASSSGREEQIKHQDKSAIETLSPEVQRILETEIVSEKEVQAEILAFENLERERAEHENRMKFATEEEKKEYRKSQEIASTLKESIEAAPSNEPTQQVETTKAPWAVKSESSKITKHKEDSESEPMGKSTLDNSRVVNESKEVKGEKSAQKLQEERAELIAKAAVQEIEYLKKDEEEMPRKASMSKAKTEQPIAKATSEDIKSNLKTDEKEMTRKASNSKAKEEMPRKASKSKAETEQPIARATSEDIKSNLKSDEKEMTRKTSKSKAEEEMPRKASMSKAETEQPIARASSKDEKEMPKKYFEEKSEPQPIKNLDVSVKDNQIQLKVAEKAKTEEKSKPKTPKQAAIKASNQKDSPEASMPIKKKEKTLASLIRDAFKSASSTKVPNPTPVITQKDSKGESPKTSVQTPKNENPIKLTTESLSKDKIVAEYDAPSDNDGQNSKDTKVIGNISCLSSDKTEFKLNENKSEKAATSSKTIQSDLTNSAGKNISNTSEKDEIEMKQESEDKKITSDLKKGKIEAPIATKGELTPVDQKSLHIDKKSTPDDALLELGKLDRKPDELKPIEKSKNIIDAVSKTPVILKVTNNTENIPPKTDNPISLQNTPMGQENVISQVGKNVSQPETSFFSKWKSEEPKANIEDEKILSKAIEEEPEIPEEQDNKPEPVSHETIISHLRTRDEMPESKSELKLEEEEDTSNKPEIEEGELGMKVMVEDDKPKVQEKSKPLSLAQFLFDKILGMGKTKEGIEKKETTQADASPSDIFKPDPTTSEIVKADIAMTEAKADPIDATAVNSADQKAPPPTDAKLALGKLNRKSKPTEGRETKRSFSTFTMCKRSLHSDEDMQEDPFDEFSDEFFNIAWGKDGEYYQPKDIDDDDAYISPDLKRQGLGDREIPKSRDIEGHGKYRMNTPRVRANDPKNLLGVGNRRGFATYSNSILKRSIHWGDSDEPHDETRDDPFDEFKDEFFNVAWKNDDENYQSLDIDDADDDDDAFISPSLERQGLGNKEVLKNRDIEARQYNSERSSLVNQEIQKSPHPTIARPYTDASNLNRIIKPSTNIPGTGPKRSFSTLRRSGYLTNIRNDDYVGSLYLLGMGLIRNHSTTEPAIPFTIALQLPRIGVMGLIAIKRELKLDVDDILPFADECPKDEKLGGLKILGGGCCKNKSKSLRKPKIKKPKSKVKIAGGSKCAEKKLKKLKKEKSKKKKQNKDKEYKCDFHNKIGELAN